MAQPQYQACLDACKQCVERCEECAYNCCTQGNMVACTRLCIDCGAVCSTCITLLSRGSQFAIDQCRVCAELCDAGASECEKYQNLDHCRRCAEACRWCAEQCRSVAGVTV